MPTTTNVDILSLCDHLPKIKGKADSLETRRKYLSKLTSPLKNSRRVNIELPNQASFSHRINMSNLHPGIQELPLAEAESLNSSMHSPIKLTPQLHMREEYVSPYAVNQQFSGAYLQQ